MDDLNINRRKLLQTVGAGATATGVTGIGSADGSNDGRFIVGVRSRAAAKAARRRATAVDRELDFGSIGRAVAGRFPPEAVEALEASPAVRYVEPEGAVEALGETTPWGVDRVDADRAHDGGVTGAGADVAVLDTGIDADHPDLTDNLGRGYAVEPCEGSHCAADWDDDNGHGSHCAGIAGAVDDDGGVVGVAPGVTLHPVKVLASDNYGTWSGVADGIRWAADQGYDVVSMSLGASSSSSTVRDACRYAYDRGVLLVAAAGNNGPCSDCVWYPAAYETVVAVSSTDSDDALSSFSSTGPEIEITAPGSSVYSTVVDGYAYYSGTSMATPHVSAAGAMLMADGYSNEEARARLTGTAEDLGLSSNDQGSGLLDVEAAVDAGGSDDADASVAVSTGDAADVGESSATLAGELTDLGGASSATVRFEYRESGASGWSTTADETLSATGTFDVAVTGLADGTEYEYRAVADASDGDTDAGSVRTVTTVAADTNAVVSTGSATDVTTDSATVTGSLDDLGGAASADVHFEWGEAGSLSNATAPATLSDTGPFRATLSGLASGTDYEFRAVAEASDGDVAAGETVAFATDEESTGDTAPAVDRFRVSESGSPNPHAEIAVDWAVSDADGDLASVLVEVTNARGSVVESARTRVGGSSASGSESFKIKHGGGKTYDVTIAVTDASGTATELTRSVDS